MTSPQWTPGPVPPPADWTLPIVATHLRLAYDVGSWRNSILPLAIRRTLPLWRVAGIPEPMCRRPLQLLKTARRLHGGLERAGRGVPVIWEPDRGWTADLAVERAAAELATALGGLAAMYGEAATTEFVLWLLRHDVDWSSQRRWWAVWSALASVSRGRLDLPVSLLAGDHIRAVLSALLGSAIQDAIAARVEAAATIPLSAAEARLVAYEPQSLEPGEPDQADVVVHMKLAALGEATRHAYLALSQSLEPSDWSEFVAFVESHSA